MEGEIKELPPEYQKGYSTLKLRPPQIGEGKEAKRTFGEEIKYIKECAGYGTDRRQRERVWVRGYKH